MQTWIFQGNPDDDYDIDGYLSSRPSQLVWLVTRYASEIAVGDRVYLWRNQGKEGAVSGVTAEAARDAIGPATSLSQASWHMRHSHRHFALKH
jgi:hypothetical protein